MIYWAKWFYWMRIFQEFSFYVRLIIETLIDVRFFFVLFVFILATFANTLIIIGDGRDEGEEGAAGGFF